MGLLDAPGVSLSKYGQEQLRTRNAAALQRFHAALANRHYAPVNIICGPSNSIGEGQGATSFARSWPAMLRKRSREAFPTTGVTGGRGFIGVQKTGESTFTWPCVLAGSPTADQNYGLKRQAVILDSAPKTATYTLQGTAVDIMYGQGTGTGTLYYKVDGGSAVTQNTNGGSATVTGGKLLRVSLGASGAHTLEVGWSSGGGIYHEGVVEYDGDESAGIRVHDAGHHGWTTTQWANRNGSVYWQAAFAALVPDLIVMTVMANDQLGGVSASTTLTNLTNLLSYIRSTGSTNRPSVLIVPEYLRSDMTASAWPAYVATAHALAASDAAVAVCDLSSRMPNVSGDVLSLYSDAVHGNDKSYSLMAEHILSAIRPN